MVWCRLIEIVSLSNGQKLEIPFNFTAGDPGTRKMDFLLYKLPDNTNVYRDLHLWLNITTSTGGSTLNSTAGTGNVYRVNHIYLLSYY